MITLIKSFISYFREKFFIKLLVTYTLIIIFALSALSFIIIKSLYASAESDASEVNNQVVQNAKSYFIQKYDKAKQVLQFLYIDEDYYTKAFELLQNSYNRLSPDYVERHKILMNYLNYSSLIDDDLQDIFIMKQEDESIFYKAKLPLNSSQISNVNTDWLFKQIDNKYFGLKFSPTNKVYFKTNTNKDFIYNRYSIIANIKSKLMDTNLGVIVFNFNLESIKKYSLNISAKYSPTIIIYIDGGELLYSSTPLDKKINYSEIYSYASNVMKKRVNSQYVTSTIKDNSTGVVVVSLINYSQVYGEISKTKTYILFILSVLIVVAVSMSILVVMHFWKRIKGINNAIDIIKTGNLSYRVKTERNNDEINQIADNINKMSGSLQAYINKEFISDIKQKNSELKQKNAEMYALQSQINPHFLYNTLESIRMRAITYGAEDVSEMIRILAEMFRGSIKKKMIVKISEELDYCKSYLELFSIRYEGKLEFNFEIENEILDYGVIRHLFQPLVENSLIHGVNNYTSVNIIEVHGQLKNGSILISISDNGNGIPKEKLCVIQQQLSCKNLQDEHVGIVNVNQRIKMIFGDEFGIKIDSNLGVGTTVTIYIPALTIKEIDNHVQGITG